MIPLGSVNISWDVQDLALKCHCLGYLPTLTIAALFPEVQYL